MGSHFNEAGPWRSLILKALAILVGQGEAKVLRKLFQFQTYKALYYNQYNYIISLRISHI